MYYAPLVVLVYTFITLFDVATLFFRLTSHNSTPARDYTSTIVS